MALQKGELKDGLLFLTQPELGLGDGCREGTVLQMSETFKIRLCGTPWEKF